MGALIAFLPDEAMILIPLGLGFLVLFRVLSFTRAIVLLAGLCLILALIPFLGGLLVMLPIWALVLMMVLVVYSIARSVSNSALGKGVTDHFFGSLVYDLFVMPFRLIGWVLRSLFRRAQ
jgi:hypothetical protein